MLVKSADSDFILGDFDRVNLGQCLKTSILVNILSETDIGSQWTHTLRNISNNQVITLVPTSPNFRFSRQSSDNTAFSHDFTKKRRCLYMYSSPCDRTVILNNKVIGLIPQNNGLPLINGYANRVKNHTSGIEGQKHAKFMPNLNKGYLQNFLLKEIRCLISLWLLCPFFNKIVNLVFFQSSCRLTAKLNGKYRVPIQPLSSPTYNFPIMDILCYKGTLVMTNKTTWTHHYHLKYMV